MSLESELASLNATLKELVAALTNRAVQLPLPGIHVSASGGTPDPVAVSTPAAESQAEPAKVKKLKAPKVESTPAAEPAPTPEPAPQPEARDAAKDLAELDTVIPGLLGAGKKELILKLNAEFGFARARESAGTDKFPAYFAKLKAL